MICIQYVWSAGLVDVPRVKERTENKERKKNKGGQPALFLTLPSYLDYVTPCLTLPFAPPSAVPEKKKKKGEKQD